MMLGQFSWSGVGEMTVVMVPLAGLPLTLMVFYLRALRDDFKQAVAESKEAVRDVHKRIDRVDARVLTVEATKVDRQDFVVKAARTNGKLEQVWSRIGEVKDLVHELRGRIDGEIGLGRRLDVVGEKISTAIKGEQQDEPA